MKNTDNFRRYYCLRYVARERERAESCNSSVFKPFCLPSERSLEAYMTEISYIYYLFFKLSN